jgi:hypothetical protein
VVDTEGANLPRDVAAFFAQGSMDAGRLASFDPFTRRKNIEWRWVDSGDQNAGWIRVLSRHSDEKYSTQYRMYINRNHSPAVQFTTLAHALGHLFLGHLGADKKLSVPSRTDRDHVQRELEAESVAYIMCARNGITPSSETYLANYIRQDTTMDQVDVYQVMRAAGQVEGLLTGDHREGGKVRQVALLFTPLSVSRCVANTGHSEIEQPVFT